MASFFPSCQSGNYVEHGSLNHKWVSGFLHGSSQEGTVKKMSAISFVTPARNYSSEAFMMVYDR